MQNAVIKEFSYIDGSIIGWKSKVGKWVRIEGLTILGEEVSINDEVYLNAVYVLPNVPVKTSVTTAGTIILF
jgi:mannose-1-phosphate guanylyltransferase